jgi:hypothetical protein
VTQAAVFDSDFNVLGPSGPRSTVSSTIGCFAAFATHALLFHGSNAHDPFLSQ